MNTSENNASAITGGFLHASKDALSWTRWMVNLPVRSYLALGRIFATIGHGVAALTIVICKAITIVFAACVAVPALHWLLCLARGGSRYRTPRLLREQAAQRKAARLVNYAARARCEEPQAHERLLAAQQQREQRLQQEEEQERRRQDSRAQADQQHNIRRQEAAEKLRKAEDERKYALWQTACDTVFSDPATANSVPQPPAWPCADPSCRMPRPLRACKHSLERLFSSTGGLEEIRRARQKWHPNNAIFAKLQNAGVQDAMVYANEMAAVLNDMVDRMEGPLPTPGASGGGKV